LILSFNFIIFVAVLGKLTLCKSLLHIQEQYILIQGQKIDSINIHEKTECNTG